jgi:hypothetical protein
MQIPVPFVANKHVFFPLNIRVTVNLFQILFKKPSIYINEGTLKLPFLTFFVFYHI